MIAQRLTGHWMHEGKSHEQDLYQIAYERGFDDAMYQAGDGRVLALFVMAACLASFVFGAAVGGAL